MVAKHISKKLIGGIVSSKTFSGMRIFNCAACGIIWLSGRHKHYSLLGGNLTQIGVDEGAKRNANFHLHKIRFLSISGNKRRYGKIYPVFNSRFLFNFWLFIAFIGLGLSPIPATALEFDPNYIISDYDLEDISTMTEEKIQSFLLLRGSALAFYTEEVDGKQKTASQIIYEAAKQYSINPQFLITMLQKEQSLVEDTSPSQGQLDWAMGFGICDSCSKSDPALQELKGFATQVQAVAEKIRLNYLRDLSAKGWTLSGWGPGIPKFTVDGIQVTPVNKATAVLYTYNPYQGNTQINGRSIGANFNFWKIWQRFFARLYPDGTIAQGIKNSLIYLIQDGKKRPYKSMSTFLGIAVAGICTIRIVGPILAKYH